MEKPTWVDEAIAKAAEKVRIALEEDTIKTPISQLPISFCVRKAKAEDKKQGPIDVVELNDYIKLGIITRQLVGRVNYLSKMMLKLTGKEELPGEKTPPAEEDVATIMQWHKDTFPMATWAGQLEKWEEERKEFDNAIDSTEKLKELVDMFIVACAIMRFNVPRGAACMTDVCALREHFNFSFLRWKEEIAKKMKKNRARKWEYLGNGNYHHVKGMED